MVQKIKYQYPYKKDQFIQQIKNIKNQNLDDYMITIVDMNHLMIGVQRTGHSNGYWYKAEVIEQDTYTFIRGDLLLLGSDQQIIVNTFFDKIKEILLLGLVFIFLWWLFLGFWIVLTIQKKIERHKGMIVAKEKTPEEKLDSLMIDILSCNRIIG